MNRKLIFILGIILCCSVTGCQGNEIAGSNEQELEEAVDTQTDTKIQEDNNADTNVVNDDSNSKVSITFEDVSREENDENGRILLYVTGNIPIVTIEGNSNASDKINAYYDERKKADEELIKEYKQYAKENLTILNGDLEYWNGYAIDNEYKTARVDDSIVSIVDNGYEFAGGAHPNSFSYAQNFDSQTGEFLTLKDVLTDVEQGTKYINDYLLKLMKESEVSAGLFEGYEESIRDILTDETWYLSEEGFVIICNVYIVSPHAAGIQEYVIPYEDFTYLVDKYKKN